MSKEPDFETRFSAAIGEYVRCSFELSPKTGAEDLALPPIYVFNVKLLRRMDNAKTECYVVANTMDTAITLALNKAEQDCPAKGSLADAAWEAETVYRLMQVAAIRCTGLVRTTPPKA